VTSKGYQCKLRLFTKLSRLSEEMAALSAEQLLDDEQALARLQNLVEQRAEVMAEIDRLPPGPDGRESAALDAAAENHLRREIEAAEKQNEIIENTVKAVLDCLKERTKKLREGKQSQRAYAGRTLSAEGSFIDKRR